MRDEIFDREYQSVRADANRHLFEQLRQLARTISLGLKAQNRIEFSTPWARRSRRATWS